MSASENHPSLTRTASTDRSGIQGQALPGNEALSCATLLALLLAGNVYLHAADFKGAAEALRLAAEASPKPQENGFIRAGAGLVSNSTMERE
jgi:hypothetical protein